MLHLPDKQNNAKQQASYWKREREDIPRHNCHEVLVPEEPWNQHLTRSLANELELTHAKYSAYKSENISRWRNAIARAL